MVHDNPAERLLAFLTYGKNADKSKTCEEVIRVYLKLSGDNLSILWAQVSKLMDLPHQIIMIIENKDPNKSHYQKNWHPQ